MKNVYIIDDSWATLTFYEYFFAMEDYENDRTKK